MGVGPWTCNARGAGASQVRDVGGTHEDHKGSLGQVIRADGDQEKWLTHVLLLFSPSTLQLLTFFFLFKGMTFNLFLKKINFLSFQLLHKPMHFLGLCSTLSCLISILPFPITCFPFVLAPVPPPTACILPTLAQLPCPVPGLWALHTRPCPLPRPGGTND